MFSKIKKLFLGIDIYIIYFHFLYLVYIFAVGTTVILYFLIVYEFLNLIFEFYL
jgi:hypothetical protein